MKVMMKNLKITGGVWCLILMMLMTSKAVAAQSQPQSLTIRGRLARTVEATGWVINDPKDKYLLLNFRRFQNEAWFREGAEVEATGETKPGTITIYKKAHRLKPARCAPSKARRKIIRA